MNRVTLYEGQYKRLVRENGWEFTERVHCSGVVVILPVTETGKVVLIEQYRVPVGKKVIEFPAGLASDSEVTRGESLIEAARRELLEETGYHASQMILCTSGPASAASSSDILTTFRAKGLVKVSEGKGDGTEMITVHEIRLQEIDRWLKTREKEGLLIDPKVYAGLYLLKSG